MNAFYGLVIAVLLSLAWGIAVSLSGLIMIQGKAPTWLQNPHALRALTPVYYVLLIGTLGLLVTVPWLFVGKPEGMICTIPVLFSLCLITFSRQYGEVRTTAEGRALCVVVFSALTIIFLPIALVITYYILE